MDRAEQISQFCGNGDRNLITKPWCALNVNFKTIRGSYDEKEAPSSETLNAAAKIFVHTFFGGKKIRALFTDRFDNKATSCSRLNALRPPPDEEDNPDWNELNELNHLDYEFRNGYFPDDAEVQNGHFTDDYVSSLPSVSSFSSV